MSQFIKLETLSQDVQFVYDESELVLDTNNELNEDIVYSDGHILVNGQLLESDGQTIVLQDTDLTQYYVNEDSEEQIFIEQQNEEEEVQEPTTLETGTIQYVQEESNNQIVYITDEENLILPQLQEEYQINEELDTTTYPAVKRIRYGQNIVETPSNELQEFQYAVFKDGKLHWQPIDENQVDLNQITGKNLLTGQTVTLHNYINNLQKRHKEEFKEHATEPNEEQKAKNLTNLINKKIPLSKPINGKRLVGKIIHVEQPQNTTEIELVQTNKTQEELQQEQEEEEEPTTNETGFTQQQQEQLARTLSGIMQIESVKKKLQGKNLLLQLVEKSKESQTITYSYGHMTQVDADNWCFIDTTDDNSQQQSKFTQTIQVTIQIQIQSDGERQVKVILNEQIEHKCPVCNDLFDSDQLLEQHWKDHQITQCIQCQQHFTTLQGYKKHQLIHQNEKFQCTNCLFKCSSQSVLKKHHLTHHSKVHECTVCGKKFQTSGDLTHHKRIHDVNSYFQCETCGRSFSKYSNLLRHVEIHKGGEALYQCDVCGSSYNYISSLTRHVVQNHINKK